MKDNMNKANANMNTNNMNLNYPPQNSNIFKDPQKRKKLIIWSIVGLISLVGLYLGGSYAKNYFFPNPKEKAIREIEKYVKEIEKYSDDDWIEFIQSSQKQKEMKDKMDELVENAKDAGWNKREPKKEIRERWLNLQKTLRKLEMKVDKIMKKNQRNED